MPESENDKNLRETAEALGGRRFLPFSQGDPFHLKDVDEQGFLTSANFHIAKHSNQSVNGAGACMGISIAWLSLMDGKDEPGAFWDIMEKENAVWAADMQAEHSNSKGRYPKRPAALIAQNELPMTPMCYHLEQEGTCTEAHNYSGLKPGHESSASIRDTGQDMSSDMDWGIYNNLKEQWERDLERSKSFLESTMSRRSQTDTVEVSERLRSEIDFHRREVERIERCLHVQKKPAPRLPDRPVGKMTAWMMTREARAEDACKILSLNSRPDIKTGHAVAAYVPARPSG